MNIEKEVLRAYDSYADAVYKFCLFRVYEVETAEDLMQETFLRFYKYLLNGRDIKFVKSFLYKTANNLIVDNSRKKKEVSLEKIMEEGFNPVTMPENDFDEKEIIKKIEKMEDIYRIPLRMRYVEGYKPKEIAKIMGKSQNVISVRIYRGLQKLKKLLPQE